MNWNHFFKEIVFVYVISISLFAEDGNLDADGNWSDSDNWNPASVPDAAGATATFGSIITAPITVTVDGTFSVGTLNFDNTNAYNLSVGSLNINGPINVTNVNQKITLFIL